MASKNIKLVTYAGSTVTPQDDALIHETAIPKSGIIYGGKTTKKTNNTLHIAAGHGIVCGRKFTISECDVPVQLTGGASHNGRVYIHMDLSNSTNPIQILIETGTQLSSEIQQKDVNILNGVYEFNLATFMVDATTIYNVVDVFPVVSGKDMSELEKTFVKKRDILKTMEEVSANKDADKVVGPEAVKELSNDLKKVNVYVGEDKKLHFTDSEGADSVIPFNAMASGEFKANTDAKKINCGFRPKLLVIYNSNTGRGDLLLYEASLIDKAFVGYHNSLTHLHYFNGNAVEGGGTNYQNLKFALHDDGFTFGNIVAYGSDIMKWFAV